MQTRAPLKTIQSRGHQSFCDTRLTAVHSNTKQTRGVPMTLKDLWSNARLGDAPQIETRGLTADSRAAAAGFVFVAMRGHTRDGHDHLNEVVAKGVVALVVEDPARVPAGFGGVVARVDNARVALDRLAATFYGAPALKLKNVGVTGTNGKTTIAYMVERILNAGGLPTGVLGTIDHHLGERTWASQLTTPDPVTLQARLAEFVALGARAAAFEVSSHALHQSRADSLPFNVAIFTNLTRDHLDYHHDMNAYFAAKERLFRELLGRRPGGFAILNGDDPWVRRTRVAAGVTTWTYGVTGNFAFKIEREDLAGTHFALSTPVGPTRLTLPSPGRHNVYNAAAALAAGVALGVPLTTATEALSQFRGAPGRLEQVANRLGIFVYVDYAHTDDALRSVLESLARVRDGRHHGARIITVFGCGGDRDRGKRPLMARAAAEFADTLILTSDNPRTEDPEKILDDVAAGVPAAWRGEVIREVDRAEALARALQCARTGDVILVAGKGHEDYQILGERKVPFSDQRILADLLKG